MAKPVARIRFLELAFALGVTAILLRAAVLQLTGETRPTFAFDRDTIPARRGSILDRHGAPLALTTSLYRISVTSKNLRDTASAVRLLAAVTGDAPARVRAQILGKKFPYWHGPFDATQVARLRGVKGIALPEEVRRAYPARELAFPIVGRLLPDSTAGASGIEKSFDSVLAGVPGEQVLLRVPGVGTIESPRRKISDPVSGNDVVLTIDANLQEIAEHVLDSTVRAHSALDGDVVVMDVRNGEILAAAGVQRNPATGATTFVPSFVTVPFEPGSTAKLFTAGALLERGRVKAGDAVNGEGGRWAQPVPGRRQPRNIVDEHEMSGPVPLDTAIKYSSNIAMAKFATRLSWNEQFDALRDFGFGSQTGIETTGEDRGRLALPAQWTPESQTSHAMGYEFRVTSVQLAAAYAAIANGGVLLSPTFVREVREAGTGKVLWERKPEPVRRALSRTTARRLLAMLKSVTEMGGTGVRGSMKVYRIAGKTGTANMFDTVLRRYNPSRNIASFAAVFPSQDPMLAVIFKVSGVAGGSGFGGTVSAPAVKSMLEQMMASDLAPVNRASVSVAAGMRPITVPAASAPAPVLAAEPPRQTVLLPVREPSPATGRVAVPAVAGRSVREATAALLQAGLRVRAEPRVVVTAVSPAPGTSVAPGTLVILSASR